MPPTYTPFFTRDALKIDKHEMKLTLRGTFNTFGLANFFVSFFHFTHLT